MARKFCPACKRLVGGAATDCECGHVFEASTVVAIAEPKICPHCGAGNPQSAHTCHCGRHFDLDADQTRAYLVRRRTTGTWLIATGLAALGAVVAGFVTTGVISVWTLVPSVIVFAWGLRVRVRASQHLAALPAPLPRAQITAR